MTRPEDLAPDSPVEVRVKQVLWFFGAIGVALEILVFIPMTVWAVGSWLFDLW